MLSLAKLQFVVRLGWRRQHPPRDPHGYSVKVGGFGALTMAGYTSKEDEAFFAAIGRLTISWAYIEAVILQST